MCETANRKFFTYDRMQAQHQDTTIDFLAYHSLVACIPKMWKIILENNMMGEKSEMIFEKIPQNVNFSKLSRACVTTGENGSH